MLLQLLLLVSNRQRKKMAEKMAESKYSPFKKYILFEEDFLFVMSLYEILNEKHEVKNNDGKPIFIMSYTNFKQYLRKLRQAAKDSCGIVCYKSEMCSGHKVLEIMERHEEFMLDCVENKALFYKYVVFQNLFDDTKPMFGFVLKPLDEVDLGWKTWSQRMSYLN